MDADVKLACISYAVSKRDRTYNKNDSYIFLRNLFQRMLKITDVLQKSVISYKRFNK